MSRKIAGRIAEIRAESTPEFLTDPEGAALLNLGITRFLDVQKQPDFPSPIWLGPRGKRHVRPRLLEWALNQTDRVTA